MLKMPRNNNQPNRRLGQVDNMVHNTQEERQERLNRLLRRQTVNETVEPRNREERREQGIRNPISEEERSNRTNWISGVRGIVPPNFMQEYTMQWLDYTRESTTRIGSSSPKYIKRHDYIPNEFKFNKTDLDNDNLFMGVELEIDGAGESDDNAKFIQEFLGEDNCYIMHDGSLRNGLEITTHPCSINYHKSLPYKDLFRKLVEKGYKSHDTQTCGLHIHVNRNFFGENPTIQDLCITKVLYLLEKHWDNVKAIARRDSSRYAERFFMKDNESMFNLLAKAKNGSSWGSAKYQIVNLIHKNTIEFRMCKGTLKYETFIATLEFVRNLIYLCKNKPLEQIQMVTFEEIIYSLGSEYLVNYIKERGIKILDNVAV
jgi:hypothetical protein